jgi:hypothetical protein
MSANASRLAPPWVRYGLIAGIIAFACTLAANLAITWLQPADLCRFGPLIIPLLSLGALVIFLWMAAAAGFATGRAGSSGPDPTLAGLLVGVLGGCALVVLLPFIPSAEHRFQELTSLCPGPGSFVGGSFSFNLGSPPPGFVMPTPPPEFFATPPPGSFATPPPGAFVFPPGPGGRVWEVLGMVVTILVGVGAAVGVATITGMAGTANHARSSQKR